MQSMDLGTWYTNNLKSTSPLSPFLQQPSHFDAHLTIMVNMGQKKIAFMPRWGGWVVRVETNLNKSAARPTSVSAQVSRFSPEARRQPAGQMDFCAP